MKCLITLLCINLATFSGWSQNPNSELDSISVELMVGQMILTGIGDQSIMKKNHPLLDEIREGKVGGVIFFEKNVNAKKPVEEIKKSIELMQSSSITPLLVSIDEEGGRVNRLKTKYGFAKTVSADYLGKINNLDSTIYYANSTASTLSNLGFNVNFAPVVDLKVNPDNPVIAKIERSYSADPNVVAYHASAVVAAHRENGVYTALKHFPGHGSSKSDTHLGVADVTDFWQFNEILPYKYMIDSGKVDCIMSAHIVNRNLDPNGYPATISPIIIKDVLRNVLGFDGVVFSDDMQMHAISKNYGFEESIKMAINAGVDILVFANNVPGNERRTPSEIHALIMRYISNGEIKEETIRNSYQRIMKLKLNLK
ncbi:MAG: glycoside hydrolase family 3 protein [Reichenbachiella sp.]